MMDDGEGRRAGRTRTDRDERDKRQMEQKAWTKRTDADCYGWRACWRRRKRLIVYPSPLFRPHYSDWDGKACSLSPKFQYPRGEEKQQSGDQQCHSGKQRPAKKGNKTKILPSKLLASFANKPQIIEGAGQSAQNPECGKHEQVQRCIDSPTGARGR